MDRTAEDIDARLAEIRALPRGWLDGEGETVTAVALEHGRAVALMFADKGWTPRLYPTPDGGVSVESDGPDVIVCGAGSVEGFILREGAPELESCACHAVETTRKWLEAL